MKNRFKNWWNRPITRGDCTKWCLGSLVLSALGGLGTYMYLKHEDSKIYDIDHCSRDNNSEIN